MIKLSNLHGEGLKNNGCIVQKRSDKKVSAWSNRIKNQR